MFTDRRLKQVITLADGAFLASLAYTIMCWWLVRATLTLGTHALVLKWHNGLFLLPLLCLVVHGITASLSETLDKPGRAGLFRLAFVTRLVLLTLAVMLPLMGADAILKRTGLDIHIAPMVLDNRTDTKYYGHTREMLRDPDLIWTFIPGSTVYGRPVNRLGFRERELDAAKRPGVHRVICLGDSVTAQGEPGYSQYLHEMLTNAPPGGGQWEAFNMGVYGYSALQGLRLFQLRARALKPDIVTVSFGRNDHTFADNADLERMMPDLSPFARRLCNVLGRRTVGRLMLHMADRHHRWTRSLARLEQDDKLVHRVSPEEFHDTLRTFVREIRAIGAIPILLTAPRKSKLPDVYAKHHQARSTEEMEQSHDLYAQIVREVCQETGAPLLDMQQILRGPEWDPHFAGDGIHFDNYDDEGRRRHSAEQPALHRFAQALYDRIAQLAAPGMK